MHPNMHMPTSGGYFLSGIFVGLLSQVKVANKLEETKVYSSAIAYPVEEEKSRENDRDDDDNEDEEDNRVDEHLQKKQKKMEI